MTQSLNSFSHDELAAYNDVVKCCWREPIMQRRDITRVCNAEMRGCECKETIVELTRSLESEILSLSLVAARPAVKLQMQKRGQPGTTSVDRRVCGREGDTLALNTLTFLACRLSIVALVQYVHTPNGVTCLTCRRDCSVSYLDTCCDKSISREKSLQELKFL